MSEERRKIPLEKKILFTLLLLAVVVSGWFLATYDPVAAFLGSLFDEEASLYCIVPAASGLRPGSPVSFTDAKGTRAIGRITELGPVAAGVLIAIALDERPQVRDGARVLMRTNPSAQASLEITVPPSGTAISLPALLPSEILPSMPEGLLEPSPRWPVAGTEM